jgi:hypothetical protein
MTVYLEIDSFAHTFPWARHYYGSLTCGGVSVQLTHPMTQSDATAHNKREHEHGSTFRYHAGDETEGFETVAEVMHRAIEVYRQHFPEAACLMLVYPEKKIIDGLTE